jgi:chitinase
MTYDMAGPWSQRTGFLAPLFGPDGRTGGAAGVVNAYEAAGVPASKLLMGVPFYGYSWKNVEDQSDGLFQDGTGVRGDHPYSEIAGLVTSSTLHREPVSGSPWLFDGDRFWTFDDPLSVKDKAAWVREHGLGGMMAWELGGDTASGALAKAMYEGLKATATVATAP